MVVIKVIRASFVFLQNLDKFTHDIRENSNAEHEHERTEYSLTIASRADITETYGGQGCKGIIYELYSLISLTLRSNIKVFNEKFLIRIS